MHTTSRPIRIAGRDIGDHRHLCALFNSPTEEYRVLVPFIQEALERGERVVHGVMRDQRVSHLARLRDAGIDVDEAQRTGHLEMRDSEDTYLPGGDFDQEAMLAVIREALDDGAARGFPLTRLMAHPECVFESWRDTNNFLAYEARLNDLMAHHQRRAAGESVLRPARGFSARARGANSSNGQLSGERDVARSGRRPACVDLSIRAPSRSRRRR